MSGRPDGSPPRRSRRRVAPVLAGVAAAVLATVLAAGPALALGPSGRGWRRSSQSSVVTGVTTGPDKVTLLGQSTWVASSGTFSLQLGISTTDRAGDSVQIQVYPRLVSRSAFDVAAGGVESGTPWYASVALKSATSDPQGGIDVKVPVDTAPKRGDTAEFTTGGSGSGVYPVQVQMVDAAGTSVGAPLSTFLVYDDGTGGFKLHVSLVVPVGAAPAVGAGGQVESLSSATVSRLSSLVSTLQAGASAPVSLAVSPQTVEALHGGDGADRAVVSSLASLVGGGGNDELLDAPYVPTNLDGLVHAGLAGQVGEQLSAGRAVLGADLGTTPSASALVVDGPLDDATLSALRHDGVRRLVLPQADLSTLPTTLQTTTFAQPAPLADSAAGGATVQSFGADPVLSGRMGQSGQPVLAAEQDLAELAMIQLETPGVSYRRGVVVVASPTVSTAWLTTFLAGLPGNPFATAVTTEQLFAGVRPLAASDGGPTRSLIGPAGPGLADASGLGDLDRGIGVLRQLAPSDTSVAAAAGRDELLAESDQLDQGARRSVLGAAEGIIHGIERQITLPGATSVTLTARAATVPITIESDSHLTVHVEVELASSELAFRPLHPPEGACRVGVSQLSETCLLVVHDTSAVTLRVPVASRTSGVFPLDVSVLSPDGMTVLASERDTIRSTAVSFVGVVLIIVGGLGLGVWWIHNIRHGRRARRLIPPPGDDPGDEGGPGRGPDDLAPPPLQPDAGDSPDRPAPDPVPGAWVDGDPVVARFFATPPPVREPEMSPSERSAGPNH